MVGNVFGIEAGEHGRVEGLVDFAERGVGHGLSLELISVMVRDLEGLLRRIILHTVDIWSVIFAAGNPVAIRSHHPTLEM